MFVSSHLMSEMAVMADHVVTNVALSGTYLAEVIVAAVAVMMLGSEYATGMIRLTFTAVPQRRAVLLAKAIVLVAKAIALLALDLAGIIRHTAGALSAFSGVLFALNPLVDLLPTWLRNDVINYLPLNAGNQVFITLPGTDALGPWTGFGVLAVYAAVSLGLALLLVEYRDA